MLKISEFAKLAHITRRSLILYDKNELFKPAMVNKEGYRFYEYEQVNELATILTLKKLGLSIAEIKNIKQQSDISNDLLLKLKSQVNDQISDLLKVNTFIDRKLLKTSAPKKDFYQPFEVIHQESFFWRSNISDNCSSRQIAKIFSEFHSHLEQFMGINGNYSGFIIDLPKAGEDKTLENTNFNLIKEATIPINDNFITTITRPAGNYLAIDIPSHSGDSCHNLKKGLSILEQLIEDRNLAVEKKLWHLNLGKNSSLPDAQNIIRLEMLIRD
ncbi:MerR family transcriptional regulator [Companilactobacillus halodurans]|uniref:MerR family transcriptional regulator n=1 Tax=Companilactobacillus halodurans TaxID=2584183 RepID=A0A5P0ZTN1_9LACO|nr:MerR family transcriptional regulator [Companilactobacillus halodurans]MQS75968.1 MerR family transcriptional regulator [Companilactobacillus halodurans]MQS96403.1 MerR family transcriptional regulator [Companilactobacillus halodurans]